MKTVEPSGSVDSKRDSALVVSTHDDCDLPNWTRDRVGAAIRKNQYLDGSTTASRNRYALRVSGPLLEAPLLCVGFPGLCARLSEFNFRNFYGDSLRGKAMDTQSVLGALVPDENPFRRRASFRWDALRFRATGPMSTRPEWSVGLEQ